MQKLIIYQNSTFFFAISMKSVPNVVCCGNLGLIFRLMASWWQFSFCTLSCFNNHKLGNTISMAPRMESFDLVFYKLLEKLLLLTFNKGNKVFHFWIGIPSQKSENYEPSKRLPWFPWKPKLCQETQFWTSFQKNFTWMDSEKGNRVLLGGGGGHNAPLVVYEAHKKPGWDGVKPKCISPVLLPVPNIIPVPFGHAAIREQIAESLNNIKH